MANVAVPKAMPPQQGYAKPPQGSMKESIEQHVHNVLAPILRSQAQLAQDQAALTQTVNHSLNTMMEQLTIQGGRQFSS